MNSCFKELSSMTFLAKFRIIFFLMLILAFGDEMHKYETCQPWYFLFFHLVCSLWDFLLWAFAQLFYIVSITKISYYNQYLSLINCSPQAFTKGKETNDLLLNPTECALYCTTLVDCIFFSKFFLLHSYHFSLFSFISLWPFDLLCQWNVIMTNILPDKTFSIC